MKAGANGLPDPANRAVFVTGNAGAVDLQIGPGQDLFYPGDDDGTIRRIRFTGQPPPPPTAGLVAAYSFNEGSGTSVADASGQGNAGTVASGTWTTQGKFASALTFNGTSTRVTVPSAPSLNLTNMTLEAWVFPHRRRRVARRHLPGPGRQLLPRKLLRLRARPRPAACSAERCTGPLRSPSTRGPHLAVTYDRQMLRLYVNGTEVASHTETGPITSSLGPLTIGSDPAYGQYFAGRIDEVRVYNAALTQAQIQADMATPIGGGPPSNTAPTATISSPAAGTTWKVGDTISFSGSASDTQDGALAASRLNWTLVQQHCPSGQGCHSHTVQSFNGVASGSFVAPDHDYPSYLDLSLTATDSGGLTDTKTVRLDPLTVDLTFQSSPTGLQLTVGSSSSTTPFTRTVIQGSNNSMSANTPQTLGGTTYNFASWSDGGAQTHNITASTSVTTYTATYQAGQDTQPPTAPSNLTATAVSQSQINLSWTASTDTVGVTGYKVERCQGAVVHELPRDRNAHGHDVQQHRPQRRDDVPLPRPRHRCGGESQRILEHRERRRRRTPRLRPLPRA